MRIPALKDVRMRGRRLLTRPIFWIVVLCFLLRLAYVFSGAPTPVQFDARIYVSCALALPLAVTHPSILFDAEARKNINYDLLYADVLRGETVNWLYYKPPAFDEALNSVFFAGPVYPAVLGALFWPNWWHDFAAARVTNAVFDAATCALLFWILLMTVGRVAAHLGALVLALYPGMIIKCGELNLEPISGMLTVLAVALSISAVLHDRPRRFFGAGLVLGLLLLTKAASSGLIVFLALGIIVAFWSHKRKIIPSLARLVVGFAIPVLPWVILVWSYFGVPGVRDPGYGSANFRSSNTLPDRGYDLDNARSDFWTYPVWHTIISQPGEYFKLYVEKFHRLWNRSYNDYRIPLFIGVTAQTWFHRLLVFLAIIGIFFWPTRHNRGVAVIAIAAVAYVSVMHTVWHSLTRYALPAMPLVIGAAIVGAGEIRRRLAGRLSFSRWGGLGLLLLINYLAWGWLDVGRMLGLAGSLGPAAAQLLVVLVRAAVLIGDGILLCRWLGWSRRTVYLLGFGLIVGQSILWVRSMSRENWVEWSTKLYDPSQVVERVIHVPQDYDWRNFKSVFLALDLQSGEGRDYTLHVQMDSTVFTFPHGEYTGYFYTKPAYRPFLRAYGMRPEQIRQWADLSIRRRHVMPLTEEGRLVVRVWVTGGDPEKNYVRLFGDYRLDGWENWQGPTFFNPSVERLYEQDDPRIWETIPRELVAAENRYIGPQGTDDNDLSPAPGRQSGDYRILILGAMSSESHVYF